MSNLAVLRSEVQKFIAAHPDKTPQAVDLFELAKDEIASGGSEAHEVDLALQDLREMEATP